MRLKETPPTNLISLDEEDSTRLYRILWSHKAKAERKLEEGGWSEEFKALLRGEIDTCNRLLNKLSTPTKRNG